MNNELLYLQNLWEGIHGHPLSDNHFLGGWASWGHFFLRNLRWTAELHWWTFHLRPWARMVLTWLEFSQATKAGCNSAMSCWYMNPNEGWRPFGPSPHQASKKMLMLMTWWRTQHTARLFSGSYNVLYKWSVSSVLTNLSMSVTVSSKHSTT